MEPKDLMIGDILMAHLDDEEKDFPVVINGLDENGTLIDGDCEFSWQPLNKENDDIQYADALFPIPLTEEILRKNRLEYLIGFKIYFQGDGENVTYYNIYPKYVHQLQHILRICKRYDDADNFKIE